MKNVRVFSYRRFSSGRQASGSSLERQIASARRWCEEHGYNLDENLALSDLGVSAYKGDNASRGALSAFLAAIEAGKIPKGSILLVESLDRLSRAAVPEAVGLLTSIVRAGVRVVSLIDGKEWNNKTIEDSISFLTSVILFIRAHEESLTKAIRVSQAFQKKREKRLPVVSIMHGPGWVKPKPDKSGWLVDPEKAESVIRVFEMAAKGHGGVHISRIANKECWPIPWRRRKNSRKNWEHTGISRLLRDRRVLGEWQPMRIVVGKMIKDGDPVANYFPAVISKRLWLKVQGALSERGGPKRLHGVRSDVFSGLIYCDCGARMERKTPTGRGYARYYCQNRRDGMSNCPSFPERVLLEKVLRDISLMEQGAFRGDDDSSELRSRIGFLEASVNECKERADKITKAIEESGGSEFLLQRLGDIEKEYRKAKGELEQARLDLESKPITTTGLGSEYVEKASKWIDDRCLVEQRHNLASALKSVVKKIIWKGDHFFTYFCSGDAFSILLPESSLARAKRKDIGIKRS